MLSTNYYKKTKKKKAGKIVEKGKLNTLLVRMQLSTSIMEVQQFLKKLQMDLLDDSAVLCLGSYPKEMKSAQEGDARTAMLVQPWVE